MKSTVPLAACLALAAVVTLTAGKAAPKPPANPPVTLGFSGQAGDGVLGDVYGNYVGNVDGVIELRPSTTTPAWSGFASLHANIMSLHPRFKRYFLFNYPAGSILDAGCNGAINGSSPTATNVAFRGQIVVKSLGAMAIGEVRAVRAHIKGPDAEFHWSEGNELNSCSATVAAYRPSWNTWTVSTDVTRLGLPTYTVPGIEACQTDTSGRVSCSIMSYRGVDDWAMSNGGTLYLTPSEVSQLGGLALPPFLGNYRLPFAITVTSTDTRLRTNFVTCSLGGMALASGCSLPY